MNCGTKNIYCGTAGDYQIARIRGIRANEIGGSYTVTVDGAGTVTCSPLTYCALVIGGTYQKELKDVCRAFSFLGLLIGAVTLLLKLFAYLDSRYKRK